MCPAPLGVSPWKSDVSNQLSLRASPSHHLPFSCAVTGSSVIQLLGNPYCFSISHIPHSVHQQILSALPPSNGTKSRCFLPVTARTKPPSPGRCCRLFMFCIFPISGYSQRSSQHKALKTRVTHVPLLSPSPCGCHLIQPKPLRTPSDAPHHTGTHGALCWALYTPSTHGSQGLCSSSPSFWNTLLPDPRDSRPVRLHLWSRGSFS